MFTHINSTGFVTVKLSYSDNPIKPILLFRQINANSLELKIFLTDYYYFD